MSVSDTPARLLGRKADLFAAIRQLEQDRDDGIVDDQVYESVRQRYEEEAADIMERLDTMAGVSLEASPPSTILRAGRTRQIAIVGVGAAVMAAIVIFLVGALSHRGGNQSATGSVPTAVVQVSPRVLAAQRAVVAHPKSVNAHLGLGNVYLDSGQVHEADQAYRAAMRLAPDRPEPRTLDALAVLALGRSARALSLLRQVERTHPTYSRAWLLDGLISSRMPRGIASSIRAWRHFLAVDPHSSMAPRVRVWLATEEKAGKR